MVIVRRGDKLKIKKQLLRGHYFFGHSDIFISTDDFFLASRLFPEVIEHCDCPSYGKCGLFLMGHMEEENRRLIVPNDQWLDLLRRAVKEYNETFKNR